MSTRTLFAATEPIAQLRDGERIIASYSHPTDMTIYLIERQTVTRRDIQRLMDLVIESGMFPPATRAFRRRERKPKARKLNWRRMKRHAH